MATTSALQSTIDAINFLNAPAQQTRSQGYFTPTSSVVQAPPVVTPKITPSSSLGTVQPLLTPVVSTTQIPTTSFGAGLGSMPQPVAAPAPTPTATPLAAAPPQQANPDPLSLSYLQQTTPVKNITTPGVQAPITQPTQMLTSTPDPLSLSYLQQTTPVKNITTPGVQAPITPSNAVSSVSSAPTGINTLSGLLSASNPDYQTPTYQGLSETTLQNWGKGLLAEGQQAIDQSYQDALNNARDTLGADGLYGSSIMADVQGNLASKRAQALQQNVADVESKVMAARQQDLTSRNLFETDIYKEQGLSARQDDQQGWATGERLGSQYFTTSERNASQDFSKQMEQYKTQVEAARDQRLQGYTLEQISADYSGKAGISQQEHVQRMGELAQAYGFDIAKMDKTQENTLAAMAAASDYDQILEGVKIAGQKDLQVSDYIGKYTMADQAQGFNVANMKTQADYQAALQYQDTLNKGLADYALNQQKADIDKGLLAQTFGYDLTKMSTAQANTIQTMIADYLGKDYLQQQALKTTPQSQLDAQAYDAGQKALDRSQQLTVISNTPGPDNSSAYRIAEMNNTSNERIANITQTGASNRLTTEMTNNAVQKALSEGFIRQPGEVVQVPDYKAYMKAVLDADPAARKENGGNWTEDMGQQHYQAYGKDEGLSVPTKDEKIVTPTYVPGTQQEMTNIALRNAREMKGEELDQSETNSIISGVSSLIGSVGGAAATILSNPATAAALFSDIRLKKDVKTIENALEMVEQMRGVRFRWKSETDGIGPEVGVIAQEVEKVLPEVVSEGPDGFKKVKYGNIEGVLIEAIKTLSEKVKHLEGGV